jgi:site-specific recombinase XerD
MNAVARVRMTGPLTSHVEGFAAELTAHGYTDLSLANQLRLMADLSRWLERARTPVDKIDHRVVARFLAERRRTHTQFITERAVSPLLRYLQVAGVVTVAAPDRRPPDELLREYERYLVEERAVLPGRRVLCLAVAGEFLDHKRVAGLKAEDVTRFVDACAGRPGLSGTLSALRSVLRFLFITSKTTLNLIHAVPSVPQWRLASLPKFLETSELDAVFATCDRRTLVGCRNYAVLLLLGRVGLRAGEVAALQLDDVDWTTGEIVIRGKGRALGRLPLPVDIGEAMVAYLRRATRSKTTRAAFVRCRAPYDAVKPAAIIAIAKTALRAAGISSGGAHRLRHTAATQMLRRGASLTEIAQVLRHRHVDTTAIYAKVDRDSLRSIAKVWPVDVVDVGCIRELARVWPGGAA